MYPYTTWNYPSSGADKCIYHNNLSNGDTNTKLGMNTPQGPLFQKKPLVN